jgi:hypothetical protein
VSEETARGSIEPDERELDETNVRAVRVGHGANCSSVGSVIDTLFLGAVAGGAIFAAVCAAMKVENVTVVGETEDADEHPPEEEGPP